MKRALLAVALVCAFCSPAFAQSTAVSGTNVLDNTGAKIASGKWCFAGTCFTVTAGQFNGSVTSATGTVTVTDSTGGTTYLSVPSVTIGGSFFSWDTFTVPSNGIIQGIGVPRIACTPGATYSQTDGAQNKWNCKSINGAGVWSGLPTPGQPATVTVGSVTALPGGSLPTVVNVGSASAAILNFGIPQGGQGYHTRSAWTANTAYAPYDVFTNSGTAYVVQSNYTSGATFGSLDTANSTVFASSQAGTDPTAIHTTTSSLQSLTGPLGWITDYLPGGCVNVKSAVCGAKGDGVTDDTAAFNACAAYAYANNLLCVKVPSGSYKLTQSINASTTTGGGLCVVGDGSGLYQNVGNTRIIDALTEARPVFDFGGDTAGCIRHVSINATSASLSTNDILVDPGNTGNIEAGFGFKISDVQITPSQNCTAGCFAVESSARMT